MRLLYLSADPGIPVLGHKGASVHVRALVCALAAKGVSMVVASPRTAPEGERLDAPAELVAIAVLELPAGEREDVRVRVLLFDLRLAERPEKGDTLLESKLMDQPL